MRTSKMNYLAVGLFVIAMLVVTVGSVILLRGGSGPSDAYHVVFDNVSDVKFGTQVRYEGYPIGQVERITPFQQEGGMRFRVDVNVKKGWQLPADSLARIGASSILAAKTIDITRGASALALKPGDAIAGAPAVDVFSTVARVAGEIGDLSHNGLMPLIRNVDGLVGRLGGTMERDVARILEALRVAATTVERETPAIAARLKSFTEGLNNSVASMSQVLSPENVASVGHMLEDLESTAQSFQALSGEIKVVLSRVDELVANADAVVRDNRGNVDKSLTDVRYTLRSVAQNVDAIVHNLDGTSRNMNEFSRLIRQNPSLLLNGTSRQPETPRQASGSRGAPGTGSGTSVGAAQ